MHSAVIESVASPTSNDMGGRTRRPLDPRESPKPTPWGALYAVLAAAIGLCAGGSRLATALGHSALLQSAVVLIILGLLAAWVRRNRSALSSGESGEQTSSGQPFSVIRLAFSSKSKRPGRRPLAVPAESRKRIAVIRPGVKTSSG